MVADDKNFPPPPNPYRKADSIDDGGPAFGQVVELRCVRVDPCGGTEWEPALAQGGMSLRDYFAAKAMQGLIADGALREAANSVFSISGLAYQQANAMLTARQAGTKTPNFRSEATSADPTESVT